MMRTVPASRDAASEAAFEFLRSPDGRAMVVRALQRRGLPLGLHDDLASEILHRVTAEGIHLAARAGFLAV